MNPALLDSLMVCLFLAGIPLSTVLIWAEVERRVLNRIPQRAIDENAPLYLRRVRRVRLMGLLGQFLAGISNASFMMRAQVDAGEQNWAWYALIIYVFCHSVQSRTLFVIESKIKKVEAPPSAGVKLTLRQFAWFFLSYALYFFILLGTLTGFTLGVASLELSDEAKSVLMVLATPLGVFLGLLSVFVLAPIFARLMVPSVPMPDNEASNQIKEFFGEIGMKDPRMRMMETKQYKAANAMVTGFSAKKPTLFISDYLIEKLTPGQLKAVIFHEASHLIRRHLLKRFFWAFFAVMLSSIPVTLFTLAATRFAPEFHSGGGWAISILIAISFQLVMIRKQVRAHEFEADSWAVFELGAKREDLEGALRALDEMNFQVSTKKDPLSYINPAGAHPTTEERVQALREREDYEKSDAARPGLEMRKKLPGKKDTDVA